VPKAVKCETFYTGFGTKGVEKLVPIGKRIFAGLNHGKLDKIAAFVYFVFSAN